jgi:hypothetical protein
VKGKIFFQPARQSRPISANIASTFIKWHSIFVLRVLWGTFPVISHAHFDTMTSKATTSLAVTNATWSKSLAMTDKCSIVMMSHHLRF